MSTFRFNFSREHANEQVTEPKQETEWLEFEEILPSKQIQDLDSIAPHANMFTCGDIEIGHVVISDAMRNIDKDGMKNIVELAEKGHSDLITGKYEGGLKIWECTNDLLQYLVDNFDDNYFDKLQVLDLGCGPGILGIYAFMKGAFVTFQDYNKEVLEYVTIPNVLLNMEDEEKESEITQHKFYSGDWDYFNKKLDDTLKYDVILTSETIYNECNYDKLINIFVKRLKKDGVAFVAAKTYYFGVGGGTRQFESKIEGNGCLNKEVLWISKGGIQREILKITHKPS